MILMISLQQVVKVSYTTYFSANWLTLCGGGQDLWQPWSVHSDVQTGTTQRWFWDSKGETAKKVEH